VATPSVRRTRRARTGCSPRGYRQFTPAFGLGVEFGYGRYGVGSFETGPQRLHGVLSGYSSGLYSASFFQAALGYTFW